MSEIFDLDAHETPDKVEPFRFKFGGEEFEARDPRDFDVRLLAEADSNPALTLALMVGEDGWERLDAVDKEFTIELLRALTAKWLDHYGLDLGKSSGSSMPSKSIRIR